ncbi:hypothetical protein EDB81DRAFT_887941 [Dactylonectria macrodidyma]|uniref:CCHC-type domain-containing protein n=1 Tax=Dactylonectria macrodidyma TaxID=307937 RepID=A0A9P9E8E0_9HYPO|nr:hypothetical protein EDB81DRAFT_887941 [Dactylonectria macrodidyma]
MSKRITRSTAIPAYDSQETTSDLATASLLPEHQLDPQSHTMATQETPVTSDNISTMNSPVSTEEEALDRRIEEQQREQRLRRKRRWLELTDAGETPNFDPNNNYTLSSQSFRSNNEDSQQRPSEGTWGRFQLPNPRYTGKSWTELQIYLTDLKARFLMQPASFCYDHQKVLFASSCFEGFVKRRWTNFVTNGGGVHLDQITWPEFNIWIRGTVLDAPTRCLETSAKLARCFMKPEQSFRNFVDYYESVEAELPDPLPDSFRVCTVIHRLTPELRTQLVSRNIPTTWTELINNGTQAEAVLKNTTKRTETDPTPATNNNRPSSDQAARTPQTNRSSQSGIICYKCGTPGHISTKCTEPNCSTCNSDRHTTARHQGSRHDIATPATEPNTLRVGTTTK